MSEAGSGIEGFKADSAFARFVAATLEEPFKLVDVGCAGGLAPGWRTFGGRLSALAYDADEGEIAALTAQETNPNVRYVQGFVGIPGGHPLSERLRGRRHQHVWAAGRLAYERVRWMKAREAAGLPPLSLEDYYREAVAPQAGHGDPADGFDIDYGATFYTTGYSGPAASVDATSLIYLPDHLEQQGFADADFLKIDVDGPDFDILRSCNGLLDRSSLLGVAIEVSFFGSHDANDNTFHNIDRLMRQKGFDLFGLSVRSYASAALPSPFLDRHASGNYQGRPFQGDAIYLRDVASPAQRACAETLSVGGILKAAALFALFGLQDQAAEVLLIHRDRLAGAIDVEAGLNLLTAEIPDFKEEALSYRDWIALFEQEDPKLYDVYGRRAAWMSGLLTAAREAPEIDAALARAEAAAERALKAQGEAEVALAQACAHAAALQEQVDTARRPRFWRAIGSLSTLGRKAGAGQ